MEEQLQVSGESDAGTAPPNTKGIPVVTVVIPSLTGDVERATRSLQRQTVQSVELIVVTRVKPAARARNRGAARARSDLILFLDDDAELGHNRVLEQMIDAAAEGDIAVVGSSKILPDATNWLQRRIAKEVPRWVYPVLESRIESNPPIGKYGFTAATTTCCLIRRDVLNDVGGFNERLVTGEDPELFYRIRHAGYRIVIPAKCWAFHAPPATMVGLLRKSFMYGVGHAQESELDAARQMSILPRGKWWRRAGMVLAPLLVVPGAVVSVTLEPRLRVKLAFRPIQAMARVATLYGYMNESRPRKVQGVGRAAS